VDHIIVQSGLLCYNCIIKDSGFLGSEALIVKEITPGIVIDPEIKGGKPVIKGTRVPVELVLGKLASGMLYEEIMLEYELIKKQILEALQYTTQVLSEDVIQAMP